MSAYLRMEFVGPKDERGRRFVTAERRGVSLDRVVRIASNHPDVLINVLDENGRLVVQRKEDGTWWCRDGSQALSIGGIEVTA